MEWNSIHDKLSKIFAKVTGLSYELAFAIWNSLPNDRMQRKILREATKEVYKEDKDRKMKKSINRILEKLDNSSNRDSAIHSPFALSIENGDLKLIPYDLSNNKHAKMLSGETDVRSRLDQVYRELNSLNRSSWKVLASLISVR